MTQMQGKTVLVTSGTSGIGFETARGLAQQGARVIMTGRDPARGQAAVQRLRRETGNPDVEVLLGDLSSQGEVRRLAQAARQFAPKLDVLVNNPGGLYRERWTTADGIEATFAVNVVTPLLGWRLDRPSFPWAPEFGAYRAAALTAGEA